MQIWQVVIVIFVVIVLVVGCVWLIRILGRRSCCGSAGVPFAERVGSNSAPFPQRVGTPSWTSQATLASVRTTPPSARSGFFPQAQGDTTYNASKPSQQSNPLDPQIYLLYLQDKMINFVETLTENRHLYPAQQSYIDNLQKIHITKFVENRIGGKNTSFTVEDGQEIHLCLRSTPLSADLDDDSGKEGHFYDPNLVTYVLLHELTHISCPGSNCFDHSSQQHKSHFETVNAWLVRAATDLGFYNWVDYSVWKQDYCGIEIDRTV